MIVETEICEYDDRIAFIRFFGVSAECDLKRKEHASAMVIVGATLEQSSIPFYSCVVRRSLDETEVLPEENFLQQHQKELVKSHRKQAKRRQ